MVAARKAAPSKSTGVGWRGKHTLNISRTAGAKAVSSLKKDQLPHLQKNLSLSFTHTHTHRVAGAQTLRLGGHPSAQAPWPPPAREATNGRLHLPRFHSSKERRKREQRRQTTRSFSPPYRLLHGATAKPSGSPLAPRSKTVLLSQSVLKPKCLEKRSELSLSPAKTERGRFVPQIAILPLRRQSLPRCASAAGWAKGWQDARFALAQQRRPAHTSSQQRLPSFLIGSSQAKPCPL